MIDPNRNRLSPLWVVANERTSAVIHIVAVFRENQPTDLEEIFVGFFAAPAEYLRRFGLNLLGHKWAGQVCCSQQYRSWTDGHDDTSAILTKSTTTTAKAQQSAARVRDVQFSNPYVHARCTQQSASGCWLAVSEDSSLIAIRLVSFSISISAFLRGRTSERTDGWPRPTTSETLKANLLHSRFFASVAGRTDLSCSFGGLFLPAKMGSVPQRPREEAVRSISPVSLVGRVFGDITIARVVCACLLPLKKEEASSTDDSERCAALLMTMLIGAASSAEQAQVLTTGVRLVLFFLCS